MTIKNTKGISLIEAMLSIAIIMIAVIGVSQVFPLAMKINSHAENQTIAANLAQAKIEQAAFTAYGQLESIKEDKHPLSDVSYNPFYNYQRETSVQTVNSSAQPTNEDQGLKLVSTTVYWLSPIFKTEKSINLKILISEKN